MTTHNLLIPHSYLAHTSLISCLYLVCVSPISCLYIAYVSPISCSYLARISLVFCKYLSHNSLISVHISPLIIYFVTTCFRRLVEDIWEVLPGPDGAHTGQHGPQTRAGPEEEVHLGWDLILCHVVGEANTSHSGYC